jgi:hypothetical protein
MQSTVRPPPDRPPSAGTAPFPRGDRLDRLALSAFDSPSLPALRPPSPQYKFSLEPMLVNAPGRAQNW